MQKMKIITVIFSIFLTLLLFWGSPIMGFDNRTLINSADLPVIAQKNSHYIINLGSSFLDYKSISGLSFVHLIDLNDTEMFKVTWHVALKYANFLTGYQNIFVERNFAYIGPLGANIIFNPLPKNNEYKMDIFAGVINTLKLGNVYQYYNIDRRMEVVGNKTIEIVVGNDFDYDILLGVQSGVSFSFYLSDTVTLAPYISVQWLYGFNSGLGGSFLLSSGLSCIFYIFKVNIGYEGSFLVNDIKTYHLINLSIGFTW